MKIAVFETKSLAELNLFINQNVSMVDIINVQMSKYKTIYLWYFSK